LFEREVKAGRNRLVELPALEVLRYYGIPTVPFALAKDAGEAVAAANQMGYPVVLKISGPKILHKTDVGGVQLNLTNESEVREAHNDMIASVRRHLGDDIEIWASSSRRCSEGQGNHPGMTRDPKFGPLLMFGLGGIYTEALRDVAFRLAPIANTRSEMVRSIRSYRLLEGVRGEPPSDMPAIAECLMRLSQLVTDHESIQELDINPLIVYARGKAPWPPTPYHPAH